MKQDLLKEIIWQFVIVLVSIMIFSFYFGFGNFFIDAIDFSFHDSYLVISPLFILLIIFSVISFLITGLRMILSKLNSLITNSFFIISASIIILLIWFNIESISTMLAMNASNNAVWTVYPPSTELPISPPNNNAYSKDHIKNTLKIIQASLFLILILTVQTSFRKLRKTSP